MAEIHALDSRAVLGLLAKAQQMFTSETTSLSFPIGTPLAFDAAQLAEAMGPAPDAPHHALLAEFSTAMNLIPEGVVWTPTSPLGLDDVVRQILDEAEWAEADRTPAEESRFATARAQIDLHNPEMAEYASLKDAWIRAKERLANAPDDAGAVAAEQSARGALAAHPARTRIEQALQDLIALDERAPHRARDRFEQDISDGVGTFADPTGGSFSPVRLLPRAVLTSAGWDAVVLDRAALDALAAEAPSVLTDHLRPPDAGDDPVHSISFEYASALLQRTWFDDALFKLRCWRFADPDRRLSDGQTPPSGTCGSYVCGVVLARNVVVTSVAPAAPPAGQPQPAGGGGIGARSLEFIVPEQSNTLDMIVVPPPEERPPRRWDEQVVTPLEDLVAQPLPIVVEGLAARVDTPVAEMAVRDAAVADAAIADVAIADAVRVAAVGRAGFAGRFRDRRVARSGRLVGLLEQEPAARLRPEAVLAVDVARAWSPEAVSLEASRAPDFVLIDQPVSPPPPVVAPDPGFVTASIPEGTVIILALICKTVPKTPDPSPDCVWP